MGVQEWIEVFGKQSPEKDELDEIRKVVSDCIMEMGKNELKYLVDFLVYDMHLIGQE